MALRATFIPAAYVTACLLAAAMSAPCAEAADGQLRVKHLCRLKGQEKNTLSGMGLVVGLNGTGDKITETHRKLAQLSQFMGGNIARDSSGLPDLRELKDAGNVALVFVSADIPTTGAIQGEQLHCNVSAISAASLQGGRLVQTFLLGPRADVPTVYAISDGLISLPDPNVPTSGVIYDGCKMEASVTNSFVENDAITLILDRDIASFSTAVDITDAINSLNQSGLSRGNGASDALVIAQAIDQMHIEVKIPPAYLDQTVPFVSLILEIPLPNLTTADRVVINERQGVIIVGENIHINPVAINHKNLAIEARGAGAGRFVGIDIENPPLPRPKLKNLVEALNAMNVPTADVIAIIRTLKANGDLYGELVIQ